MLSGKKILIGVCGGIAAYKIAFLVRLLVKQNAQVRVIMTNAATDFITPLTLATLSKQPVLHALYDPSNGTWANHVELGLWADLLLVAPASANTIAKMANGICDNLLTAVYLSARCPVWVAPAMDLDMWQHPATQRNISILQAAGNAIVPVETGELASGLTGEGRMAEPTTILQKLQLFFDENAATNSATQSDPPNQALLKGKKVLLTAGPTHEPIDPVRFIGNRSSGKMGIALANACYEQGASVTLILGPTHLTPNYANINVKRVETAAQMFEATVDAFLKHDIAILAAAVADYSPAQVSEHKIKKKEANFSLELQKTRDILAYLGNIKQAHQLLVGFALETDNELNNAISKLQRKNLDLIVLNSLQDAGAGFQHDTNQITLIDKNGNIAPQNLQSKTAAANDIIKKIATLIA
jgi:phosphopantothenoylcysteine decarboxylase/phosphopantothenate--cysteine ligase